jgi:hypothetical protein
MGFDDEVEQSFRRPCRWLIGRSKRTYELRDAIGQRDHRADTRDRQPRTNSKKYFYGLLLICERGTTGLGHINS